MRRYWFDLRRNVPRLLHDAVRYGDKDAAHDLVCVLLPPVGRRWS